MIEGQRIVPAFEAHRFRGEYLDCFARIEDHLMPVIERLVKLGEPKKAPHLFGLKFDLVLKSASTEGLWEHRHHVYPILEELKGFAELRGLIGHAMIEPATIGGSPAIILRAPGDASWQSRKVITEDECITLITHLKKITARLLKQRIAAS